VRLPSSTASAIALPGHRSLGGGECNTPRILPALWADCSLSCVAFRKSLHLLGVSSSRCRVQNAGFGWLAPHQRNCFGRRIAALFNPFSHRRPQEHHTPPALEPVDPFYQLPHRHQIADGLFRMRNPRCQFPNGEVAVVTAIVRTRGFRFVTSAPHETVGQDALQSTRLHQQRRDR
jgi:hypothetical protein